MESRRNRENGEMQVKEYIFTDVRGMSPEDLMCSVAITVNTVLYT